MDPEAQRLEEIRKLFYYHDVTTAAFRAELAQRSAGEVLYDDYLLAQMRKGKPFKVALRKANARFPTEALSDSDTDLAELEAHYRFFLDMCQMDEHRKQIGLANQKIAVIDEKIAQLLESKSPAADAGADQRSPPPAPGTAR